MAAKVEHYFGQGWREVCAAEGWDPSAAGTWLAPAIDRHPDMGARRWRAVAGHPREPERPRADRSVLSAAASRDTAGWIRGRRVPASGRRRSRGPRTGPGGQRLDAGPAARPWWLRRSGLRAATCRYSRQAGLIVLVTPKGCAAPQLRVVAVLPAGVFGVAAAPYRQVPLI